MDLFNSNAQGWWNLFFGNQGQQQPIPQPVKRKTLEDYGWVKGTDNVYRQPTSLSTALPTPKMMPIDYNYRFAYENLPRDQWYSSNGPRPNFQPQQPPADIGALIREFFPNEATAAAAIMASENATFDPNRPDNPNTDQYGNTTYDRGIPQINSGTFDGLMKRQGSKLKSLGINSFDDMRDPRKSFIVAQMIKEGAQQWRPETNPSGWGGWFGWQDTGYDLNKGYYSEPDRQSYELKKRGR